MIWVERGGGGEQTILLLHGLGATGAMWTGVRAVLERRGLGHWICPDLPGHGGSAWRDTYSVGEMAAAVAPLVRDIEPLYIVGHSLGISVGLALASGWYGVRVAGFLGLGPKITWPEEDIRSMREMSRRPPRIVATEAEAIARFRRASGLDETMAPGRELLERGIVRTDAGFRLAQDPRTAEVVGASFASLVAAARCPVMLARGAHDAMQTLAELRAYCEAAVDIPGGGHNAPVEAPGAIVNLIEPLIRTGEATAPDAGSAAAAAAFDPGHLPDSFFADPYPTYRALQRHAPVHRCPDGSWFLTRYADLDRIYRDRKAFSSDKKAAFGPKYGVGTPLYAHHTTSLVFNDAPYHTRVRRSIVGALTPHVMKAMVPGVEALVDGLLDRAERKGQFDLVDEFAAAIPVEVIGNLLRVPHEERGPLRDWSLAILGALEPSLTPEQQAVGNRSVADFLEYLKVLVADRRRNLGGEDDMLSRLIREETAAEPLTEGELLHNCIFLLNAGHETTTNLIGNGLHLLLTHPEELARLRAEPGLIATAVEECLRYESPNQLGNRLVVEPVEVGGTRFQPGDYLTLCIGAANRDPHEFPDPDRFDIGRTPNRHLAFAAGAHACAGMSVARLEAQVAIPRIIARFPRLRLTGPGVRNHRVRFRGFATLPASVE